jgi:Immunity protein 35
MSQMTRELAFSLAKSRIDEIAASVGDEFEILVEKTVDAESGWVFFYNSKEFIETRNPIASLAGNGPIFVKLDGTVHDLPSSTTWEVAMQNIK